MKYWQVMIYDENDNLKDQAFIVAANRRQAFRNYEDTKGSIDTAKDSWDAVEIRM